METVNLLILDYDGTLADCKELHQQAFRKACMKVNNAIRYTDEEVEGMPTFVKIDYLKAKGYQFDETLLMDLKQEYTMNDISKYVKFDQELKVFNLASSKQIHDSFLEIEELLLKVGYLLKHTSKAKISRFKDFILRANTSMHEINVLRGIVHQMNWFLNNSKKNK